MTLEKDVIYEPVMQLINGKIRFVLKVPPSNIIVKDVTAEVLRQLKPEE